MTTCLRKARRGRGSSPSSLLIRYNTHAPWRTTSTIQTNGNNHHFFIRIPILGHVLVHSVDKTHVLVVVTVELIWLLFLNIFILSTLFQQRTLSFTRFRGSYVNRTAVVLTNHCQSYTAFLLDVVLTNHCQCCTAFLLDVGCSKWPRYFFCSCLSPMIVHLRNLLLLRTCVAQVLLTPWWVSRQKDVK